jgi:cob(I)alamin adenosyltransferase
MHIYTKRGDKGETDLFNPKTKKKISVSKDSLRIEVIGSIDEVVSYLGIIKSLIKEDGKEDIILIERIQTDLFLANSILAGLRTDFQKTKITFLEKQIDVLEKALPKLSSFILPGGNLLSSHYYYVRTVVRRAERNLVKLSNIEKVTSNILIYLNRLSDLMFMLGRKANFASGIKETKVHI